MGTLAYMSPEQAVGQEVDARTDIFSCGVVLYQMATGQPPFRGKTPAGILGSILTETPQKPSALNTAIPAKLDRLILKALEKDREVRYQSVARLSADVEHLGETSSHRKAWLAAGIAALAAALGMTAAATRWGWFVSSSSSADLTARQVTANPPEDPVMQASLSPDGRTVAYEDFAGIHLRRIDTGDTRLIAPPDQYCFR